LGPIRERPMERAKTCANCTKAYWKRWSVRTDGTCSHPAGPEPPKGEYYLDTDEDAFGGLFIGRDEVISFFEKKGRLPTLKEMVSKPGFENIPSEDIKQGEDWLQTVCIWISYWAGAYLDDKLRPCHREAICEDWKGNEEVSSKLKKCLGGEAKVVPPFKIKEKE